MANIRSAAKQARAALRRRVFNLSRISKVRNIEKQIRALAAKGDKEGSAKLLGELQSSVDKAAKGKTIHRHKANRIKARMAKLCKT